MPIPTQSELTRICQLEDPTLRNLLITQRYHDLSHCLACVLGPENANWATFATWASKTAGRSIRGEEVPGIVRAALVHEGVLENRLHSVLSRMARRLPWLNLQDTLLDAVRDALEDVMKQVAIGNQRVFEELAPLFSAFAEQFTPPERRTGDFRERFLSRIRPGPCEQGGQDNLKLALGHYHDACTATSPKARAELVLSGNLLIGFHEQTRLQENIQKALDAPIHELLEKYIERRWLAFLPSFVRRTLRPCLKAFVDDTRIVWEHTATLLLMNLSMPRDQRLALSEDVPRLRNAPPDLQVPEQPVLIDLLTRFDTSPDTLRGSGANNWADLSQRMHFITDLFRSCQQEPSLFEQPFRPEQHTLIERGEIPRGSLS